MNLSLFPKNEEWGTGDEALDVRLTHSLKKASENLSLASVYEFYTFAHALKTRAFNPAFPLTIDQVSRALLFELAPEEFNDDLFKKMRGRYFEREKMYFRWELAREVVSELKKNQHYRYKSLLDFSLKAQPSEERNPFVSRLINRSSYLLTAKIIFKEYRQYLCGEKNAGKDEDQFSNELKSGKILIVEGLGEFWFSDPEVFCLSDSF